jgi:hypothetical protein
LGHQRYCVPLDVQGMNLSLSISFWLSVIFIAAYFR